MVSIIIPNYNKSKYIEETISSVLKQDYKDWECIIIDDFSSDNSVSIISRLINNEKRFHLIKNLSNKGANFSRNLHCLLRTSKARRKGRNTPANTNKHNSIHRLRT